MLMKPVKEINIFHLSLVCGTAGIIELDPPLDLRSHTYCVEVGRGLDSGNNQCSWLIRVTSLFMVVRHTFADIIQLLMNTIFFCILSQRLHLTATQLKYFSGRLI